MLAKKKTSEVEAKSEETMLKLNGETHVSLQNQLVREVKAMASYAMSMGICMPVELLVSIDKALMPKLKSPERVSRQEQLGWNSQNPVLPMSSDGNSDVSSTQLAAAHLALAQLVAPASPGTLAFLQDQKAKHPIGYAFGAIPLARKMLLIGIGSLIGLLAISLSSRINSENIRHSLLASQGISLLYVEMFLSFGALIGASLANLKRLEPFISNCTYSARYESSYWIRMVVGLISGIILSQFLTINTTHGSGAAGAESLDMEQPLLALLGGFSGEFVHNVLNHFVGVLNNIFGTNDANSKSSKMIK